MDVISGCAGLSENVARQTRPVSSGQVTATESSLRTTLMGPGRTPARSSGTDTAGGCNEMRIRGARKARQMFMAAPIIDRMSGQFVGVSAFRHASAGPRDGI